MRHLNYYTQNKNRFSGLPLLIIALLLSILVVGCSSLASSTKLTNSFLEKKGNITWPSEGAITQNFGTEINPIYGTESHNPGILISTGSLEEVKSVFSGEVVDVYDIPEFGRVVTISHGEYTSLYGNMSSIKVSPGMIVEEGQLIGMSGGDNEPKGEAVFFALFREAIALNPEPWLEPR